MNMKYNARILSFMVLNQINLRSEGEPFATILKTCHSNTGFFKSLFSPAQNKRNSVLSRAASIVLIERASIYHYSQESSFKVLDFHKWFLTLYFDKFLEDNGRTRIISDRCTEILHQLKNQFCDIPVILYPEEDGYWKISYQIAKQVLRLTTNNPLQSQIEAFSQKLELFCKSLINALPTDDLPTKLVEEIGRGCDSRRQEAEQFSRILPLPYESNSEKDNRSAQIAPSDDNKKDEIIPLSFLQLHLVMLSKKKQNILFLTYFCSSPNREDYSYELKDEYYPKDLLFISFLLADFLKIERYQKPVDDFSVEIFQSQSKVSPKNSLSLTDINSIIKSVFDDVVHFLLYYLPLFMDSKKGLDLANEIRKHLIVKGVHSNGKIKSIIDKLDKNADKNGRDLFEQFFAHQVDKVISRLEPQTNKTEIDAFTDSLANIFIIFANIVAVSYQFAYEDVYFKKHPETLEFLTEVESDVHHFEKVIRNSLGMLPA